jgi:imidazolonepropionase-like amidohydrolase
MTPEQALATTTTVNAMLVPETNRLGVIAPGAYADIVALQGDPMADISVVLKGVRWVMKGGHVVVDRQQPTTASSPRAERRQ